jgi:hypothetical protein
MSIINEIIRLEEDGGISFGDYESKEKRKAGLDADGSHFQVKTHDEVTRLEKNGMLLLETVPGAAVHGMVTAADEISFALEGFEDTRITIELEPDQMYRVLINGTNIGNVRSNMAGKVIFSLELDETRQKVEVKRV